MVGSTHAVVGEMTGAGDRWDLAYQIWKVPEGEKIGGAIHVRGSLAGIAASLPGAARKISQTLDSTSAWGLFEITPTAEYLATVGAAPWSGERPLRLEERRRLKDLTQQSALAGILCLENMVEEPDEFRATACLLLRKHPSDPQILAAIAALRPTTMGDFEKQVTAALSLQPHSFGIAYAATVLQRERGDLQAELKQAELATRCDPENPDAWLSLGTTLSNLADGLRESQSGPEGDQEEQARLQKLYSACLRTVERARGLDPCYGKAWLRVSTAAAFSGDQKLADSAYQEAAVLDQGDADLYWWGIQLYQPKWIDDREKLKHVALLASADPVLTGDGAVATVRCLQESDFRAEAQTTLSRIVPRLETEAIACPSNLHGHYLLANAYRCGGRVDDAAAEYRQCLRIRPGDRAPRYELNVLMATRSTLSHEGEIEQAPPYPVE